MAGSADSPADLQVVASLRKGFAEAFMGMSFQVVSVVWVRQGDEAARSLRQALAEQVHLSARPEGTVGGCETDDYHDPRY